MVSKKFIAVIVILIIAYVVISSLLPSKKNNVILDNSKKEVVYQSCEERCSNNQVCLEGCYTTTINQAVLNSDINKCNTTPLATSKQPCLDKVNFQSGSVNKDSSKCYLIQSQGLKETCLTNAQ